MSITQAAHIQNLFRKITRGADADMSGVWHHASNLFEGGNEAEAILHVLLAVYATQKGNEAALNPEAGEPEYCVQSPLFHTAWRQGFDSSRAAVRCLQAERNLEEAYIELRKVDDDSKDVYTLLANLERGTGHIDPGDIIKHFNRFVSGLRRVVNTMLTPEIQNRRTAKNSAVAGLFQDPATHRPYSERRERDL